MKDRATIFSVNPIDMAVDAGQLGHMVVKGAGTAFFGATKIDGRTFLKDLGDDNFQPFEVKAIDIAKDIVGRYDLEGMFLTDDDSDPSPKRIAEERQRFREFCVVEARHADAIWDRTHNRELIGERARRAARYLGTNPPWADAVAEELKECPRCAETIKAKASFCKHCRLDLNEPAPVASVSKK